MDYCDIVIPVWNEKELTKQCIERIKLYTEFPFRLIVIDNGSGSDTREYLESEKQNADNSQFILIRNEKNLGFVKASNQGLRISQAPYVLLLNNDTLVCRRWLVNMIDAFNIREDIGIVNPSSNVFGQDPGIKDIDRFALDLERRKGRYKEMDYARGFCMLIKRDVVDKVGFFDEVFGMGYFEEADFSRRARKSGYTSVISNSSYVYHNDRASFKKIAGVSELFGRNRAIYYARWGKPVWASVIIDDLRCVPRAIAIMNDLLSSGHKVLVFLKKGISIESVNEHINLKKKELSGILSSSVLFRILRRKKSKRIKCICADGALRFLLTKCKFAHGAGVFGSGDSKTILEFSDKLSFEEAYINEKE